MSDSANCLIKNIETAFQVKNLKWNFVENLSDLNSKWEAFRKTFLIFYSFLWLCHDFQYLNLTGMKRSYLKFSFAIIINYLNLIDFLIRSSINFNII